MARRPREYYVGGRSKRRLGPVGLVAALVVAVAGAASYARFAPVIGAPTESIAAPEAVVAVASAAPATPEAASTPPSPAPSIDPDTVGPVFTTPLPCRPPAHIEAAPVVSHGDFKKKTVALTFDDGINPANTKQILRILKKYKVNATFFPTGEAMRRFPDVWKAVAKAGYPIANHT